LKIHRTKILGFALLLAGLALCAAGLWLLLSPPEYQAVARIALEPDSAMGTPHEYDPYFIQTEFEVIQSEVVLGKVVDGLNLNEEWGRKNAGGNRLKTVDTIDLLKRRINLRPVRSTTLIEISVTSNNSDEAAKIANAIAKAYHNYRVETRQRLALYEIKNLEGIFQKQEQDIKVSQAKLEQLRNQLNLPNFELGEEILKSNYPSYFLAKQEYDNWTNWQNLLKTKIEAEKSDLGLPKTSFVEITDPAVPPTSPSGPNRLLGGILLTMGLASSAGGFFLLRPSARQSA
jgi:uncharacterized protein involved in exopolysaccharide biosynthesis